jgi:hypothetical protein
VIDWVRLGQAVLIQAGQDAMRDDDVGREAREWLTAPSNGLREAILNTTTPYSQDDINKWVVSYGPASP